MLRRIPQAILSLFLLLLPFTVPGQVPPEYALSYGDDPADCERMIVADTALFYRPVQLSHDLFRRLTDYGFSFAAYRHRGELRRVERIDLEGAAVGWHHAASLRGLHLVEAHGDGVWCSDEVSAAGCDRSYRLDRSGYPLTGSAALQATDRTYRYGARMSVHAPLRRGWDLSATLHARLGRDMHVQGVYSRRLSAALAAGKRFSDRARLDALLLLPIEERGLRSYAAEQTWRLTGDRYYNPVWGYQNGEVRNSRVRRQALPLLAALFWVRLSPTTELKGTVTTEVGERRTSALGWYDARTPMPDHYRSLPGYWDDPSVVQPLEAVWRARDPRYTQVNWEDLYRQNRMAGGEALYYVADRVERQQRVQASFEATTRIDDRLCLRYGVRAVYERERRFRRMDDLLGADYLPDLDAFLIDDHTYGNRLQNNLRDPDRRIGEGDRFGYDYAALVRGGELFAQADYRADRFRLTLRGQLGRSTVSRYGFYEKELFPGSASYGSSREMRFAPFLVALKAGYAFSPRSYLEAVVMCEGRAPDFDDLFLNPEYNNRTVDDPAMERSVGSELNYTFSGQRVELRVSLYARSYSGMGRVVRYYDDAAGLYADMAVSNIGIWCRGAELSAVWRIAYRWRLSLAASAGRFDYSRNPVVTVYADADNAAVDERAECFMGGCRVGGTPQVCFKADLNWFGKRGWGFILSGALAARRYVDPSYLRRTRRIASQLASSPEAAEAFTRQECLPNLFQCDLRLFKSFYFDRSRLTLTLAANNLFDACEPYNGYESHRIARRSAGGGTVYAPHDSRYLYALPRSWFVSVSFGF